MCGVCVWTPVKCNDFNEAYIYVVYVVTTGAIISLIIKTTEKLHTPYSIISLRLGVVVNAFRAGDSIESYSRMWSHYHKSKTHIVIVAIRHTHTPMLVFDHWVVNRLYLHISYSTQSVFWRQQKVHGNSRTLISHFVDARLWLLVRNKNPIATGSAGLVYESIDIAECDARVWLMNELVCLCTLQFSLCNLNKARNLGAVALTKANTQTKNQQTNHVRKSHQGQTVCRPQRDVFCCCSLSMKPSIVKSFSAINHTPAGWPTYFAATGYTSSRFHPTPSHRSSHISPGHAIKSIVRKKPHTKR